MAGGGLSLKISEVPCKIVLAEFLLEGKLQSVGAMDVNLNNEMYNYSTISEVVASPWHKENPIKPIGYEEGYLKIADILLIYPLEAEDQKEISLMPGQLDVVLYMRAFAIHGQLSVGADVAPSGILETSEKRFLPITNVSVFPMFPSGPAPIQEAAVGLVSRANISHYHVCK